MFVSGLVKRIKHLPTKPIRITTGYASFGKGSFLHRRDLCWKRAGSDSYKQQRSYFLFVPAYILLSDVFFDKLVSSFLPSLPISGFEPVTMPDELILERADVYKTNGTRLHFAKSVPRISLSSLTIILSIHVENGVIYMLTYSELLTLNQLYCHCNAISCHGYGFFFSF